MKKKKKRDGIEREADFITAERTKVVKSNCAKGYLKGVPYFILGCSIKRGTRRRRRDFSTLFFSSSFRPPFRKNGRSDIGNPL